MFDVKKHLIKVQGGRQYLPVAVRLVWFRQDHPDWGIETKPLAIVADGEMPYAVFEARIYNAEGKLMATGTKMENLKGFGDWLEKAETGAIGRALAVCGYGTQFAPDLDEMHAKNGNARSADGPTGGNGRYGGNRNRYANGGGYRGNGAPSTSFHAGDDAPDLSVSDGPGEAGDNVGDDTACSACGKELNTAQKTLSERKYGVALCPKCQQERKAVEAA